MPKAYVIARVDITDPETYAVYAAAATEALKKSGGRVLVRGGRYEALEGQARARMLLWNSIASTRHEATIFRSSTKPPRPSARALPLRSSFWSKAYDCGSRRDGGQVHRLPRAFSPKGAGIMFSRSPGLSTSAGSSRTDSGSRHASTRSPRSPTGRRRTLPRRPQPSGLTHRYFQHALATSPSVSRLRALGVVDRTRRSSMRLRAIGVRRTNFRTI